MAERRQGHGRRRMDAESAARWGRRVVGAYLLLLTVAVIAVWTVSRQTDSLTHRVNEATYASCYRLQLQRVVQNRSNFASWRFYRLVVHLTATSRTRAKPQAEAFAHQLSTYGHGVLWTPLTDCQKATNEPLRYRPPAPRAFYLLRGGKVPSAIQRALHVPR